MLSRRHLGHEIILRACFEVVGVNFDGDLGRCDLRKRPLAHSETAQRKTIAASSLSSLLFLTSFPLLPGQLSKDVPNFALKPWLTSQKWNRNFFNMLKSWHFKCNYICKVILRVVKHGHSHLVILSLSLLCLSLEALKGHEQAWCMGPKALIALYLYHDLYWMHIG